MFVYMQQELTTLTRDQLVCVPFRVSSPPDTWRTQLQRFSDTLWLSNVLHYNAWPQNTVANYYNKSFQEAESSTSVKLKNGYVD